MALRGKKILLGICGSIAAYKVAVLTRLLVKAGADVQIVMTPDAVHFITPLTLSTLSQKPVLVDYFDAATGEWNNHVHLALDADVILIAPASANTIAKFANGLCDNLLSAIYLSAKSPVLIAPAMDLDMWKHPATRRNVATLQSNGNSIIPPGAGELASGLEGEGRLAEPEEIMAFLVGFLGSGKGTPLAGKTALVAAGPTYEAIDPVRFIGNHSSGKMGFAIAAELRRLGAEVTLISGPTALETPLNVQRRDVVSAQEMMDELFSRFADADITVMSAAVADYRPQNAASQKIKKATDELSLQLVKTTDILAQLGNRKRAGQVLVGFALETNDEEANAISKLHRKNLDFIVLNSMNDDGAGFAGDNNKVTIIHRDETSYTYPLKSKAAVASDICQQIVQLID